MKTARTLALLMGLTAFLFISCNKADQLNTEPAEETTAKRIVIVSGGAPIELPDCWSTCINTVGPYIETSGHKVHHWGNSQNPNWKTVNYVAYNTASSFVVKVTFTQSEGNRSNKISVNAFGTSQYVPSLVSGSSFTFNFTLPTGWQSCDLVPFSISQEVQSASINISSTYNLYTVCD